ncbi:Transcription elongation factor SPT6 [Trachipleistophora hominis]|uniref:Transcription elongation factor SPT6 n=1 Tax=Trachipleistophora hominis TaxID=72359 RepID=L7K0J7_TRAHO|nr:Transcription elongation factor SPT6 [Trachipleistophora hominis]
MSASSEEEIYKRIRPAKKHDDLNNLFDEESSTPSNAYYDTEPANLEEIFGTGQEYAYIYAAHESAAQPAATKCARPYVAYSDVLRYARNNEITNTEIIKKLYDGYDVNFIALHCVNSYESGELMSVYDIYRMKEVIEGFPTFYRLRQMVQGVFGNRMWTVEGMRQLLMYEKYEDVVIKGVLRTDDFAENLFFEDRVSVPGNDEEEGLSDEELLGDEENGWAEEGWAEEGWAEEGWAKDRRAEEGWAEEGWGESNDKKSDEDRCDRKSENNNDGNEGKTNNGINNNGNGNGINNNGNGINNNDRNENIPSHKNNTNKESLRRKIKGYVLRMSKHPYLNTYARKYFDRKALLDKLCYYFGVDTDRPTRNDRLRKTIVSEIVAQMDSTRENVRDTHHDTFTAVLDAVLNTAVARPTQNDTYLCMTEDKGHAKIVVMNYLGNACRRMSVRNTEKSVVEVIKDVRPKYIFVTGRRTALRFFYSALVEWTDALLNAEGFHCTLMYADPFVYAEDVFEMLLHVGRRCLYPEIELMHIVSTNTLPYFVKDSSRCSLSAARRALTLGLAIVGIDLNYLMKCDRARIIAKFVPLFNAHVMRALAELGFVSRLEILKDVLCTPVEMDTRDDTFICFNAIDGEVLYANVCTYLRIYRSTFDVADRYNRLDELLVHPANYHSARMICAAAMDKEELDEDNNYNAALEQISEKGELGALDVERLRMKKDVFDILNVMMYKRTLFRGLCDAKVFEMLVGQYENDGVYAGSVIKVCDGYLIVRVHDNWCVFVRVAHEDSTRYFENDELKVRITEKNVLGLSFRGEIVHEAPFFLQSHPLYVDCTAAAAHNILRQRRQLLLLRKSSSKQYGVVTLRLTDEIFVHYKIEQDNGGVLFNNRRYENVDHVIYCYFREMVKILAEVMNDKDYGTVMRLSKKRPGYLEIGGECVCMGNVLRRGDEVFRSVGELKERLGLVG